MPTGIYLRTEEHKRNIGLTLKGKKKPPRTEEHRRNAAIAQTGKISPLRGRKRLDMVGDKNPMKRMEIRLKLRGEKSYLWKGGITLLRHSIRSLMEYRQWRSDVFTRDNFTCVWCGNNESGNLNADHIKPFGKILEENKIRTLEEAIACEEFWNINNGRTLCVPCHKKTDTYLRRWEKKH